MLGDPSADEVERIKEVLVLVGVDVVKVDGFYFGDEVVVLEAGRIVQQGTHEQLMKVPGPYLHVASLQLVDDRELQELKLREGAA